MSRLPPDYANAPLLIGALVAFGLSAWLFSSSDQGVLVAAALLVIGSVLTGALVYDWARRGRDDDNAKGPPEG